MFKINKYYNKNNNSELFYQEINSLIILLLSINPI